MYYIDFIILKKILEISYIHRDIYRIGNTLKHCPPFSQSSALLKDWYSL